MSGPILFLLGASHHTTPLELREKLALTADKLPSLHEGLRTVPGLEEYAVLNTCNRVEFYGVAGSVDAVARVQETFCRLNGFDEQEFQRIRQTLTGPGAVRHLLEVSSGLDSQMIGENEIFGQVKSAYAAAQERCTVGPVLNRLFQKAFHAAKHVRTHTAITEGQISVANVAVDLAVNIFGDLASAQVLLLGAGEIGEKTAKAFQSRGAGGLTVSSRTLARAMELASMFGAVALPFEHFASHLHQFDIVVCSTAAPGAVVSHADVVASMKRRPARPLFLIDLALPRDVDNAVAGLANVFLYNLDDLAHIADQNRAVRAAKVAHARELVEARTNALWEQLAKQCGGAASAATSPAASAGPSRPLDGAQADV